jgi:hypothetical protein
MILFTLFILPYGVTKNKYEQSMSYFVIALCEPGRRAHWTREGLAFLVADISWRIAGEIDCWRLTTDLALVIEGWSFAAFPTGPAQLATICATWREWWTALTGGAFQSPVGSESRTRLVEDCSTHAQPLRRTGLLSIDAHRRQGSAISSTICRHRLSPCWLGSPNCRSSLLLAIAHHG